MALEEARKRGLLTVALLGYDGGEIAPRPGRLSPRGPLRLHSAHSGSAGLHLPHHPRNLEVLVRGQA